MLPDFTLPELLAIWPTLADDYSHVDQMPPDVADDVTRDYHDVARELRRRDRLTRMAEALCQGHDGCMLMLPEYHVPADRLVDPEAFRYRWKRDN
jgi:hypothetical protein